MNVFDLVCVLLIALSVLLGYHRGVFRVVFRLGAYAISVLASRLLAPSLSAGIYRIFIAEKLQQTVSSFVHGEQLTVNLAELNGQINDSLPASLLQLAQSFHILPLKSIPGENGSVLLDAAGFTETVLQPIVTKVLIILTGLFLFIFFSIIFSIIMSVVYRAVFSKKHTLLRINNRIAGGALGFLKALLPVGGCCAALNLIAGLSGSPSLMQLADGSIFCRVMTTVICV